VPDDVRLSPVYTDTTQLNSTQLNSTSSWVELCRYKRVFSLVFELWPRRRWYPRLILHCIRTQMETIVASARDTDVLLLLHIAQHDRMRCTRLYMKTGTLKAPKYFPVHEIRMLLSAVQARDVPNIRFRFHMAVYPAVFYYPVPAGHTTDLGSAPFNTPEEQQPPSPPAKRSGERCKLLQRGPEQSPGRKWIWYILGVIEHFWWKDNPVFSREADINRS